MSCWICLFLSSWRRRERRREDERSSRSNRSIASLGLSPHLCPPPRVAGEDEGGGLNALNGLKRLEQREGEMEFQTILYEVRNQIAFVTFNRPESMNAVNRQMARELVEACKQIEEDNAIRIAIFTGAGDRAFSAGMDLKERAETGTSPIERRQQKLSATIHSQSRAVAAITKPTIAAIRGYCVGGGLEFALACDMRVAAEDAKLGLAEVKRGLIPGAGGTQRLARTVGIAKALEICLTGDNVSGSEAQRLGLVNIAVPASDVMKAAEDLAGR